MAGHVQSLRKLTPNGRAVRHLPHPRKIRKNTSQIGAGGGLPEPVVYKVQTTLSNLPSMNFGHIVRPVMSAAFRRVRKRYLLY